MSDLFARYDAWVDHRAELTAMEEQGGPPPGDWHYSDDEAVELLDMAMHALCIARDGVRAIAEALSDHYYAYGVGFTCSEAGAYYDAQIALGLPEQAEHFMRHHAESDLPDEGDLHEPVGDHGWRERDGLPTDA